MTQNGEQISQNHFIMYKEPTEILHYGNVSRTCDNYLPTWFLYNETHTYGIIMSVLMCLVYLSRK
jgi:hypothetical protein